MLTSNVCNSDIKQTKTFIQVIMIENEEYYFTQLYKK